MRARARYQATRRSGSRRTSAFLDNQNPTPGIQYDFRSRDNSLAAYWTPDGGKRISVMAEYDRSTLYSSIDYLLLPFYTPSVSRIPRQRAHGDFDDRYRAARDRGGHAPKLTAGGSLFISAGSRATQLLPAAGTAFAADPQARTMEHRVAMVRVRRAMYLYEGFRTHTFMTGLRVSR